MFILLAIIFIGIPIIKELVEDAQYREWCRKNGVDKYVAVDGTYRYTSSNKKVYK